MFLVEEENVLEVLRKNPDGLNITQLKKLTGLSKTKVSETLNKLENEGKVQKIVKGCRKIYKLK